LKSTDVPVVSCADVGPAVAGCVVSSMGSLRGYRFSAVAAVPTAVDVFFATVVSNASGDQLLLASLVLLAFLLLLDPCRAVCVPAVANVPAIATFLLCWRPCSCWSRVSSK